VTNRHERRAAKARGEDRIEVYTSTSGIPVPDNVDELLETTRHLIEANWNGGCSKMNLMFFAAGDRIYQAIVPYPGMERSVVIEGLRNLIAHVGATKYTFVFEGLAIDGPDRGEFLMIGAADGNGARAFGAFEIKRDTDGRATLANWRVLEAEGWVYELFAPALGSTMH
jgi:hypothetical protein